MRARLGGGGGGAHVGHSSGHSSGGSGVLGGHLAAGIEAASPAWQSPVAPMASMPVIDAVSGSPRAAQPAVHHHHHSGGGGGGMPSSPEVEALRALVSAEADSELREIRSQLASVSRELLGAKSEGAIDLSPTFR